MEYLVTMTTHVPDGTSDGAVEDIRARRAAHSLELSGEGPLLRLWRPPVQPGEWQPRVQTVERAAAGGSEFLTTFAITVPRETPSAVPDAMTVEEADRARELATQGKLRQGRMWRPPSSLRTPATADRLGADGGEA